MISTPMSPIQSAVRAALDRLVIAFEHDLANPEGTVAIFTEALRDMAPIDIQGAVNRAVRTERFFPRPAVLRSHALEEQSARSAMRPPERPREDRICPLCDAAQYWVRTIQQPEPDPRWYRTEQLRANHRAQETARVEILHAPHCPIRHRDQISGPMPVV